MKSQGKKISFPLCQLSMGKTIKTIAGFKPECKTFVALNWATDKWNDFAAGERFWLRLMIFMPRIELWTWSNKVHFSVSKIFFFLAYNSFLSYFSPLAEESEKTRCFAGKLKIDKLKTSPNAWVLLSLKVVQLLR